jgi:hypothetical protein
LFAANLIKLNIKKPFPPVYHKEPWWLWHALQLLVINY